jgi:hypothetical protein
MNGLGSILGRGLLVLALSGFALVGCGDDDGGGGGETDAGEDAGPRAGHGGGGAGHAGGGAGGGAGDGGSTITPEECEEMAVQAAGPECLACVCAEGAEETVACEADCWALVECVGSMCDGDGTDIACITSSCSAFLGGNTPAQAMAFGPIITQCLDVCQQMPGADSGTDAGN